MLGRFLAAALLAGLVGSAQAQPYPSRPVTFVVPFAAGGPTDTLARILTERMRVPLGQTVIIENATGAAGSIGVGRVARGTGRIHRQHRPLEHACGQRCDLRAAL